MATATAVTTALPGTGHLSFLPSPRPQTKPRFTLKTPDCVPNLLLLPRGRMPSAAVPVVGGPQGGHGTPDLRMGRCSRAVWTPAIEASVEGVGL